MDRSSKLLTLLYDLIELMEKGLRIYKRNRFKSGSFVCLDCWVTGSLYTRKHYDCADENHTLLFQSIDGDTGIESAHRLLKWIFDRLEKERPAKKKNRR
jgi:hypothetical protein